EAKAFTAMAKTAGLAPPSRFGTEVVTRLLALRTNHPAKDDALERPPTDPPGEGRPPGPPPRRPRPTRRGRLLCRPDRPLQGLGASARPGSCRDLLPPAARRLAAQDPHDRGQARRLPVHLGRDERADTAGARQDRPWRLRLLGLRLARLQAPGVPRCGHAPSHAEGPNDLCDERRS